MIKNNIDYGFWAIMAVLVLILLSWIFMPGCAVLQRKDTPTIVPTPVNQLWQAAKSSNWIVTISILGIAGGIFATLNGQKWGMAVVVSCSVALFMSLAVARFAWWMAICGLFGSVGLCVASISARKRALFQIIKGGELYKKALEITSVESDEEIKMFKEAQIEAQKSKSTQKIVEKIKSNLKAKGEIE